VRSRTQWKPNTGLARLSVNLEVTWGSFPTSGLPTESQVFEDEVLPGTENAEKPAEEMSERHNHGKNLSGQIRIQRCAKSFILLVYDVLARHNAAWLRDGSRMS
jgi:hypothetical protein